MMQFVMSQDKTSITPPEAGLQLLLHQWDKIIEVKGVLFRRIQDPNKGVLEHEGHGHQGIERTELLVKERCYWPKMH